MSDLADSLHKVKLRVERYGASGINEQDTKATLLQPVLRALGWDIEDLEDVQREYKIRKQDKPVDYSLFLLRTPCLFVEAKALGENFDDRKWANQIMGYAGVAGVGWVVLTDGNEYLTGKMPVAHVSSARGKLTHFLLFGRQSFCIHMNTAAL